MTPGGFDALFDSFRTTVFRLESFPSYDVGGSDAERIAAFREGGPIPERSVRTSPWLARLAVATVAGKRWERVRVVDEPLTEYQRYELLAYQESQAAGEEIRVVTRSCAAADWGSDFWLFDPGVSEARAVAMDYAPDGRWLGAALITDLETVRGLAKIRLAARSAAVPLNEFLVSGDV